MTQVYDYTEKEGEVGKRPIEFVFTISGGGGCDKARVAPHEYDYVARINEADTYNEFDLFVAWDDGASVARYLGHWNDGVVE